MALVTPRLARRDLIEFVAFVGLAVTAVVLRRIGDWLSA